MTSQIFSNINFKALDDAIDDLLISQHPTSLEGIGIPEYEKRIENLRHVKEGIRHSELLKKLNLGPCCEFAVTKMQFEPSTCLVYTVKFYIDDGNIKEKFLIFGGNMHTTPDGEVNFIAIRGFCPLGFSNTKVYNTFCGEEFNPKDFDRFIHIVNSYESFSRNYPAKVEVNNNYTEEFRKAFHLITNKIEKQVQIMKEGD